MNQQEKDVIAGIFDRLRQAENQPRDAEAEKFIADQIKSQPYAPYVMAQAIHVQETALTSLQQQVEQLQGEVRRLQSQPAQGGFLSGLFGGGARPAPQPMQPAPAPWQQAQQPAQQAGPWGARPAGGGFLATAASTAMGVAGGMLLANAISSAFSGHGGHSESMAGGTAGGSAGQVADQASGSDSYGSDSYGADSGYDAGGYDDGGDLGDFGSFGD